MQLTDKKRVLWVDAICINQEDLAERNSQVLLTSQIYSGCTRCLIWLGEEDDETEAAFRLIQIWSEDAHYNEWRNLQDDILALAHLSRRPWWSRVWTIQEKVLSPEKVVYCGGHSLGWSKFILAKECL